MLVTPPGTAPGPGGWSRRLLMFVQSVNTALVIPLGRSDVEPAHLGWQSGVGAAVGVEPGGVVVLQVQHLLAVHRAPGGVGHRPLVQRGAVILHEKGKQRNP